jgi:NAD(P)-dependent dehydrogenase (short-subunit alcohol dehydrogenase family)
MNSETNVLVTGCGSGFGRLTAMGLAKRGYSVVAALRDPKGRDAAVAQQLTALASGSAKVLPVAMDISSDASVEAAFAQICNQVPHLEVVVNNAGISALGLNEGFTSEQFLELVNVNAVGAHRVNRQALALMKPRRRGLLVHVSTGLSRMPMPCFGLYAASKAALESLAEIYRYELAPLGIDSVILQPAAFPTNLGAAAMGPKEPARLEAYGELATLPERMMQGLAAWFGSPNAPNPEAVVEAIIGLIETPPGQRPLRTTVGGGPDELNRLTDELQRKLIASQGLGELLQLDTSKATPKSAA